MQPPGPSVLRDYAFVGDGERGALIDPDGGVGWLCFPGWADPAAFAGLLGSGGTYRIHPLGRRVNGGSYENGTLIWRSRWVTERGLVESREALAYPAAPDRAVLLRRVVAIDAPARVRVELEPAADYGRRTLGAWRYEDGSWGCGDRDLWAQLQGAPANAGDPARSSLLSFELDLSPGERCDLVLQLGRGERWSDPVDADALWRRTESAWRAAVPSCEGMVAEADVRRSIAVLRAMTTASGATVAAATTSLPERAESDRNYDYRYAWIRDICYVGQAGAAVPGAEPVLDDAVRWVVERLAADGSDTMPAYRTDGEPVPEAELLGLPGYPGGVDVVGNRVREQHQLDLFGEALLLLARAADAGRLDGTGHRALGIAATAVGERWGRPESGIWEIHPSKWVHSRLICVAGLRAAAGQTSTPSARMRLEDLADAVMAEVARTGTHPSGRWQRAPDDARVDASLLLAQVRGATTAGDPRSVATRRAVADELCADGYLYRYPHEGRALGDAEGSFVICNFWMAMACLQADERAAAGHWFERARAASGTAGIFSEEFDVAQRQLRGNLPQAFVHALLIEASGRMGPPVDGLPTR